MKMEFDPAKSKSNQVKHGVSFDEAATALLDPMALVKEDPDSENERRWVLVGMSAQARLLTVVCTLRQEDRIRLISARK
ncbi:MAG: BrnT family toxin, partial [Gammaproteobacteria bacterium]|nr:BrnT family toxin [Gammaproteobacteria bacterium]